MFSPYNVIIKRWYDNDNDIDTYLCNRYWQHNVSHVFLSCSFIKANPYPGISTNTKAGINPYPSDDTDDDAVEVDDGIVVPVIVTAFVVEDDIVDDDFVVDDDDDDDVILTLPTP